MLKVSQITDGKTKQKKTAIMKENNYNLAKNWTGIQYKLINFVYSIF